jgi:hypothetical protein
MTPRFTMYWIAIGLLSVVLFVLVIMYGRRITTTISTSSAFPSDVETPIVYVPYPTYEGFRYGDCFKNGVRIGYAIQKDCTDVFGGDRWLVDEGFKKYFTQ